ncbi:MAG TPA: Gfo/Idh/MocA family oxidoreductase [Anaerolineae bacterium]|nr:Gfo/Idh/MocA family oxidoreductase [Anaerolineae bacterium]
MMHRIGIAVVGMGWMGTQHSESYLQVPKRFAFSEIVPDLVVCVDEVEARARAAQSKLGFQRYALDLQDALNDPEVQVVNICTPNNLHLPVALAAAKAGKHIFCEKPVGRTPEETEQIAAAAREAGVLSFVGYNYRWAPLVQYAKQLIQEGRIGDITHYRGRFFAGYATNPNAVLSWRFQSEVAGLGSTADLLSHVTDMAHMLAGPIRRVVANRETFIPKRPLATPGEGTHFTVRTEGPMGEVTNEDYVGALVTFANGAQGTLEACRVINGPQCEMAFELNGTRGALRWNFERMNELEVMFSDGADAPEGYTRLLSGPQYPFHAAFNPGYGVGLGYADLKTIEAFQFLQSIVNGKQGAPGLDDAAAVARVIQAIQKSWDSERWENV